MWKEHFKSPFQSPKPVTPLPADPPARRPSPLERCDKRPSTQASYNDPPKRRKSNMRSLPEEELDLQHDPVPISLDLPSGIEIQPNPAHASVSFETPVKILPDPPTPMDATDDVITPQIAEDLLLSDDDSSSNSSSSSSSFSSSSSDSDSDEEFTQSKFEPKIKKTNDKNNKKKVEFSMTNNEEQKEKARKEMHIENKHKTVSKEKKVVEQTEKNGRERDIENKQKAVSKEKTGQNNKEKNEQCERIVADTVNMKEKTGKKNIKKTKGKMNKVKELWRRR